MKETRMDTERLAALLAGRVNEADRAKLLAELAASDEDFSVYFETAAVLRTIEEEEGRVGEISAPESVVSGPAPTLPAPPAELSPLSMRRRRGWSAPPARWLALAAVLVLVALVPILWLRRGPGGPGDPVLLLAAQDAGLPPEWIEDRPWSVALGRGGPLTPSARAARLGALHADLVLAIRARDASGTSRMAGEAAALLAEVPGAGQVRKAYQDVAGQAGGAPEQLGERVKDAGDGAALLLEDRDHLVLGAWTEAGRIAAMRQDEGFFRVGASRAVLRRAARLPGLPPGGQDAVRRLRAARQGNTPPDWKARQRDLDVLLRALAS